MPVGRNIAGKDVSDIRWVGFCQGGVKLPYQSFRLLELRHASGLRYQGFSKLTVNASAVNRALLSACFCSHSKGGCGILS
jgi:hypothetical protein